MNPRLAPPGQEDISAPEPAASRDAKKYLSYAVLIVILCAVVGFRVRLLNIPFQRDEGIYSYFGQLVLDGKTPYIDFYEMKFPGIYYAYALLILIFGNSVAGLHAGIMILNLATVVFLFLIGRKLFDNLTGLVTAAAYGILSLAPHVSGFTAQSEHIVAFFSTASLLALLVGLQSEKKSSMFLSGLLVCTAFLVKPNAVFLIAAFGLVLGFYHLINRPVRWKTFFLQGGSYTAGVFILFGVIILLMMRVGALNEMWYWTLKYPKSYVSQVAWADAIQIFNNQLVKITTNYQFLWILAVVGLVLATASRMDLFKKLFLWVFFILSFSTIVPGYRFYGHYWIQFLPAVALLIGVAAFRFKKLLSRVTEESAAPVLVAAIFCLCAAPVFFNDRDYLLNPNPTRILRSVYSMNPFPEAKVIGDFIKSRTTEDDRIAVIGAEPQVYFYADRRCPSRHAYFQYLINDTQHHQIWQQEFMDDVEKARPKYLVLFANPESIRVFPGVDRKIFSWLGNFTARHYRQVGIADMLDTYQTHYVWGEEAETYRARSEFYIIVFEHNPDGQAKL